MLESCDTLVVRVVKKAAEYAIVSNSKLPTIVAIDHMNDLDPVCQNWQAVCLQQVEQNEFVGSPVGPNDCVQGAVKRAKLVFDATRESITTFDRHTEIIP